MVWYGMVFATYPGKCLYDEPAALVVLDVCANLSNNRRVAVAVEIVILRQWA